MEHPSARDSMALSVLVLNHLADISRRLNQKKAENGEKNFRCATHYGGSMNQLRARHGLSMQIGIGLGDLNPKRQVSVTVFKTNMRPRLIHCEKRAVTQPCRSFRRQFKVTRCRFSSARSPAMGPERFRDMTRRGDRRISFIHGGSVMQRASGQQQQQRITGVGFESTFVLRRSKA
jgi:hypothetical protein